mgnify:CR=1 FL=1
MSGGRGFGVVLVVFGGVVLVLLLALCASFGRLSETLFAQFFKRKVEALAHHNAKSEVGLVLLRYIHLGAGLG